MNLHKLTIIGFLDFAENQEKKFIKSVKHTYGWSKEFHKAKTENKVKTCIVPFTKQLKLFFLLIHNEKNPSNELDKVHNKMVKLH